ncbi:MAG TPA: hypothetical protein VKP69_29890 [Isosphaeraceae bacterium]|nr:hypothetical protein [Isosphaeraceae bacterium]
MIGLKELVLIGLAFLVLYGRSGVSSNRYVRVLRPWLSPVRRPGYGPRRDPGAAPGAAPSGSNGMRGERLFWSLTIVAAAAVAAWIVTRILIAAGSRVPP